MTQFNQIAIERLASGVCIIVPGFGFAEVLDIRFDGSGYEIEYARSNRGWDDADTHYVDAGGSVEHGGIGAPRWTRTDDEIADLEWEAKTEMNNLRSSAAMAELDRLHADTASVNAPAMMAAE